MEQDTKLTLFGIDLRHTCEQNEGMAGYGWTSITRDGGVQEINDPVNKVNLTTEFTKIPGGAHGGNWGARIKGVPRAGAPADLHTTLVFYIGLESGSGLQCARGEDTTAEQENVQCQGSISGLGSFSIRFPASSDSSRTLQSKTSVQSLIIPGDTIWEAKCKGHTFLNCWFDL
jgi:mannosyl-oligosaccharide glucosidase